MVAVQQQTADTVLVTETLRDTVVTVEADSSMIRALIECDSLGQAHLKQVLKYQAGERAKPPDIKIKDNVLTATTTIDSMSIHLALKDKYKEVRKAETITKVIEVNKLTRWQNMMCTLGHISLGAIGLFILWGVRKIFKHIRL